MMDRKLAHSGACIAVSESREQRWGRRRVALFSQSFDLAYGSSKQVHESSPSQGCT